MVLDCEYKALSREKFLWKEMRVVAKLIADGCDSAEIKRRAVEENVFQFPTLNMASNIAGVCIKRLYAMESESLVRAIATMPPDTAKIICLYAIMKQNRTVCDFMVSVIGEKFRTRDLSFARGDATMFMKRLQEQNETVASWSAATVTKTEATLVNILAETEYLDSSRATSLNPTWIPPFLREAIIENNDEYMLPAFNCFM